MRPHPCLKSSDDGHTATLPHVPGITSRRCPPVADCKTSSDTRPPDAHAALSNIAQIASRADPSLTIRPTLKPVRVSTSNPAAEYSSSPGGQISSPPFHHDKGDRPQRCWRELPAGAPSGIAATATAAEAKATIWSCTRRILHIGKSTSPYEACSGENISTNKAVLPMASNAPPTQRSQHKSASPLDSSDFASERTSHQQLAPFGRSARRTCVRR